MQLEKLSISLTIAFANSDGPFDVLVNDIESIRLTKEEIDRISEADWVVSIDTNRRLDTRRWEDR